jgi:hypothetical protein
MTSDALKKAAILQRKLFRQSIYHIWGSSHRCLFKRSWKMKNVEMTVEVNILTIKVDLTKEFGPSSSGKTIIIASTEGNVAVEGHEEAKVGLNVYRKR